MELNREAQRLDNLSGFYDSTEGNIDQLLTSYYTLLLVKKYIKGDKVVQMGLGDGYIAGELCKLYKEYVVIEGSMETIKRYGNSSSGYKIINSLFEDFKTNEKFDCLIGSHVLEHVENTVDVLVKSRSWLKKGGIAFLSVPNAMSLHRRIGVKLGMLKTENELNEQDLRLGHRRVYKLLEFESDIKKSGYKINNIQGYVLKLLSNQQMKDWSKDLLDACYEISLILSPELCTNIAIICEN